VTELTPGGVEQWDRWLAENGPTATDVRVVFHNKDSGLSNGLSKAECDDTAMCHGWTMAGGRSLGDGRRAVRYVPRKPTSPLSDGNRARARRLIAAVLMRDGGLKALPAEFR
jgi:hypothetical protein